MIDNLKKNITLVIMAAGMGSRFGGLKQVENIGPCGEFIIDYSIYDAIQAGFTKVVFIIKKENYELFRDTIGRRIESHIQVEYCFQTMNTLSEKWEVPSTRIKPLGTAHAILCCRDKVKEPFAVINADDYYGKDTFVKASNFLLNVAMNDEKHYGMIGYFAKNTLTENGAVKRGVCKVKDNYLQEIVESTLERVDNKIIASPVVGLSPFDIGDETIVSMNVFLLTPSIFDYLKKEFAIFLEQNHHEMENCEFFLPSVLHSAIKEEYAKMSVLKTESCWFGITYPKDLDSVKKKLKELIKKEEYKKDLWN